MENKKRKYIERRTYIKDDDLGKMSVKDMNCWFSQAINKELREPSVNGQLGEITRVNNGTLSLLLYLYLPLSLSLTLSLLLYLFFSLSLTHSLSLSLSLPLFQAQGQPSLISGWKL